MRKEPAARCSAAVIGWLAVSRIEGGVGGVAHEITHRPPRLRPTTAVIATLVSMKPDLIYSEVDLGTIYKYI